MAPLNQYIIFLNYLIHILVCYAVLLQGYTAYILSGFGEWTVGCIFAAFVLSYIPEFRSMEVHLQVSYITPHQVKPDAAPLNYNFANNADMDMNNSAVTSMDSEQGIVAEDKVNYQFPHNVLQPIGVQSNISINSQVATHSNEGSEYGNRTKNQVYCQSPHQAQTSVNITQSSTSINGNAVTIVDANDGAPLWLLKNGQGHLGKGQGHCQISHQARTAIIAMQSNTSIKSNTATNADTNENTSLWLLKNGHGHLVKDHGYCQLSHQVQTPIVASQSDSNINSNTGTTTDINRASSMPLCKTQQGNFTEDQVYHQTPQHVQTTHATPQSNTVINIRPAAHTNTNNSEVSIMVLENGPINLETASADPTRCAKDYGNYGRPTEILHMISHI